MTEPAYYQYIPEIHGQEDGGAYLNNEYPAEYNRQAFLTAIHADDATPYKRLTTEQRNQVKRTIQAMLIDQWTTDPDGERTYTTTIEALIGKDLTNPAITEMLMENGYERETEPLTEIEYITYPARLFRITHDGKLTYDERKLDAWIKEGTTRDCERTATQAALDYIRRNGFITDEELDGIYGKML